MLVYTVPEDLYELLQDGCLASVALLRKLGGVVIVAINAPLVLVVGVLGTKYSRTHRAREMLNVVLAVQSCYVGAPKCPTTGEA